MGYAQNKKGKAAYAVVWEVISEKHADFRLPGYLSGAKGGTDARIASADDSDPHSFVPAPGTNAGQAQRLRVGPYEE
jgi:hypothetical protein